MVRGCVPLPVTGAKADLELVAGTQTAPTMSDRLSRLLEEGWAPIEWSCPELTDVPRGTARIRTIAASGFSALGVPQDFGGSGVSLAALASAQRQVAVVDPSAAIALNMHSHTVALLAEYWRTHTDTSWLLLEGIAESGSLLASAFAESTRSANFLRASSTVACPQGKGYVVSGRKVPCSLVSSARLFCVNAQLEGTDDTIVALVPAGSDGLTTDAAGWSSVGMNESDTGALLLDSVFVDRRLVFYQAPAEDLDPLVVAGIVSFSVMIGACYHGVLSRLVRESYPDDALGPLAEASLGEAVRHLLVVRLSTCELARAWDARELAGADALFTAMALRATLSDVRDQVVSAITPWAGGRLYSHSSEAALLALDSLAVHHHPPALRVCDPAVGAYAARGVVAL